MIECRRRVVVLHASWLVACGCSGLDEPGPAPVERVGIAVQASTVTCDPDHPECTITSSADGTVFRIDRPVVDREQFDYPQIAFAPGDRILFEADGCAQTGGFGDTWHDYVAPLDDPFLGAIHPDALHWGGFSLPGVQPTTAFRDIMDGEPLGPVPMHSTTPLIPGVASHLVLHYQDDDYSGNGYNDHDDGEGDQCSANNGNDGGPAHVIVHIEHGPPPPPSDPTIDWDLVGNQLAGEPERFDDNGFRLDPRWGWQVLGRLPPTPSNQELFGRDSHHQPITADNVGAAKQALNDVIRVISLGQSTSICDGDKGHLNWDEVTVRGTMYWHDHSSDDDWNIHITSPQIDGTPWLAATTVGNNRDLGGAQPFKLINAEFDSDETVDHDAFDQIAWWRDLHDDVDLDDFLLAFGLDALATHAVARISGHDGVMTGLLGLDTVHPPWASELHPVHVFAVRIAATPDLDDDGWAFFIRNSGNEGFCSSSQHYIDARQITLTIPRPPGATTAAPQVRSIVVSAHLASSEIDLQQAADGLALTANLEVPVLKGIVVGEIHLSWEHGDPPQPSPPARASPMVVADEASERDDEEVGSAVRDLLDQLSPAQAARVAELTNQREGPRDHSFAVSTAIHLVPGMFTPGPAPATFTAPSEASDVEFAARLRSYCDVTGGQINDFSTQLCGVMSRRFGQSCTQGTECPATGRCDAGRCEAPPLGIWEIKSPLHDPGAPFSPLGAYVPTLGGAVVYGGISNPGPGWNPVMLDAMWRWDGNDFVPVAGTPGPGGGAGTFAYDPVHDALWGYSQSLSFYEASLLWRFDVASRSWAPIAVTGPQPARLDYGTAVFDPAAGRTIAFGGGACYGTLDGFDCPFPAAQGVWSWDGASWTQAGVTGAPPLLYAPAVALDEARGELVVFGGMVTAAEVSSRTFSFRDGAWTERLAVHVPPGRSGGRMTYDPARRRVILYGGRGRQDGQEVFLSDTWEWDGQDWQLTNAIGGVFSGYMPVLAHDPVRHRTLAYGYFGTAEYYTLANSCAADGDCGSGHCVDGVCCAVVACGAGEACNTDENPGQCSSTGYLMTP